MFTALSKQLKSIDISISANVNLLLYEDERKTVFKVTRISRKLSLGYPETRNNNSLTVIFLLTLHDGELSLDFPFTMVCSSDRPLGYTFELINR